MAKLEIGQDTLCPACLGGGGKYKNRDKPDEKWFPCGRCGGEGTVKNEGTIKSRKV